MLLQSSSSSGWHLWWLWPPSLHRMIRFSSTYQNASQNHLLHTATFWDRLREPTSWDRQAVDCSSFVDSLYIGLSEWIISSQVCGSRRTLHEGLQAKSSQADPTRPFGARHTYWDNLLGPRNEDKSFGPVLHTPGRLCDAVTNDGHLVLTCTSLP